MNRPLIRMLVAALPLVVALNAAAETYYVNPEGTGDAPTIQAAIDLITGDFDEIVLADGVYTGPGNRDLLNREKVFHLRSESNDPTACIIDAQGSAEENHFVMRFACN